jgi:hypothetical protein
VVVWVAPPAFENAPPSGNGAGILPPTSRLRPFFHSAEELAAWLRLVPEVDLDSDYLNWTKKQIDEKAKEIVAANKDDKDTFVRNLMKKRQDLAGLPFLLGKDCTVSSEQSKILAARSLEIRTVLAAVTQAKARKSQSPGSSPESDRAAADTFFSLLGRAGVKKDWLKPDVIPALQQMLPVENRDFRLRLVGHLNEIKDAKATEALVNRALFDLDPDVRLAALTQMRGRRVEEYGAALKKALRYPWQPVVRHAAEVIAVLDLKELIPDLVALLDEPNPSAPFAVKGEDGKEKIVVRELVRINHHRNCMLCHAPIDTTNKTALFEARNLPVGPCPSAQEPLPSSSSTVYYAARQGVTVVRADITYLRQDFSLMQSVSNPGKWSDMQRFDFVVRTRELTAKEIGQPPPLFAEYNDVIAYTLFTLTGKNAPPTAQAWREVLAQPEPRVDAKVKAMR